MGIEINLLKSEDLEDFKQLLSIFDVVFEYEPYNRPDDVHLKNLLRNKTFHAIVAKLNNMVVAGLTAYFLEQYHSRRPVLYIQDLAVLTEYQRNGFGRKLIEFTHAYCRINGYQEMFVQAEKIDDYAVAFYRSTKPSDELEAVHFSYVTEEHKPAKH